MRFVVYQRESCILDTCQPREQQLEKNFTDSSLPLLTVADGSIIIFLKMGPIMPTSNYRPITIVSAISIVLEKNINDGNLRYVELTI